MKTRRFWTPEEDATITVLYPDMPTAEVAERIHRSVSSTYQRAYVLGLTKSAAYLASPAACRLRRGDNVGAAFRFVKGQTPPNKGLRRPGYAPGRMKETQFRKGERRGVAVKLWKPIGTDRVSKDGYLERKINDGLPLQARWRAVHLVLWEAEHGPLPPGHAIVFVNGDRTDIRLDNLALITRGDLMRRNTVHNLPAPLPQTIQLLGALNRKINRRNRQDEEQDRGSQEPPVRDAGSAIRQGQPDGDRASEGDRRRGARGRGLSEGRGVVHERDRCAQGNGLHPARRRGVRITASARRRKRRSLVGGRKSASAGVAA